MVVGTDHKISGKKKQINCKNLTEYNSFKYYGGLTYKGGNYMRKYLFQIFANHIVHSLKDNKFQNEFMKSSRFPKI